ncbi:MAG: UvrD-helicase domain-containing protein [Chloroflexota bacterium]
MERAALGLLDELIGCWRDWHSNRAVYLDHHIPRIVRSSDLSWLGAKERSIVERLRALLAPGEWARLASLVGDVPLQRRLVAASEQRAAAERVAAEEQLRAYQARKLASWTAALEADFLAADQTLMPDADSLSINDFSEVKSRFVQQWADRELREPLDLDQATAVAATRGDILVVARAGSGKTRTLVARAAFLQKHCGVGPDEMLLLAFNRKAVEEIQLRLHDILGERIPHVMTFHALAYAIVHPDEDLIYDDQSGEQTLLSREIQEVIDEHIRSPQHRDEIRTLMLSQFREDWERVADGHIELAMDEFLAYRRALPRETLRGDFVKSFGEKIIANALFEHGVTYKYEQNHDWNGTNYRPDFTVELGPAHGVVIEYLGLSGEPDYDQQTAAKHRFWSSRQGWRMLEYIPRDITKAGVDEFIGTLLRDLEELGLHPRRRTEEDIWQEVRRRALDRFTAAMRTFVARCRKRNLRSDGLAALVMSHPTDMDVERKFLAVAQSVYEGYLRRLALSGMEDFDGLLWRAVAQVRAGQSRFVRNRGSEHGDLARMRFVMIDEFQDFTDAFFGIAASVRAINQTVDFFCVGDDWQAINGFAGSNLQYFVEFPKHFRNTTTHVLHTNYRSTTSIVDAGNALMFGRGNPARTDRAQAGHVSQCDLGRFIPSVVEQSRHQGDHITPAVLRLTHRSLSQGHEVVLLSRTNSVPWYVHREHGGDPTARALQGFVERIRGFLPDEDRDRVTASTVHRYKGRERSSVILLDAIAGSYPLVHPAWLFLRVFGDHLDGVVDEERRLLYVAITRARESLMVVTDSARPSPFLAEVGAHLALETVDWSNVPPPPSLDGQRVDVCVFDAYEVRDLLKDRGFRWDGVRRCWHRLYPAEGFEPDSLRNEPWMQSKATVKVHSEDGTLLHVLT